MPPGHLLGGPRALVLGASRPGWLSLGTVLVLLRGDVATSLATVLLRARKEKGKKRRGGKKRWWLPVQPWGLRNAITRKLDLLEGPGVSEGGFYCPDTSGRRWVG